MPKLPADLPENWTRGQIVSPDGIEVGLTEQHGYNYLMKQVNATQTEVNGIQDALPNVAQQQTVEEINEKIGTTTDSNGSSKAGSVFAKLNQLITDAATMVGRWTQSRADKVDSIGMTTDAVGSMVEGSVFAKLNKLINGVDVNEKIPVNGGYLGAASKNSSFVDVCDIEGKGMCFISSNSYGFVNITIDGNLALTDTRIDSDRPFYLNFSKRIQVQFRATQTGFVGSAVNCGINYFLY